MKTLHKISLILTVAAIMVGCEQRIDPADRYIPVPNPEPVRYVLIEEYTGIHCKNCPNGHQRLTEIEAFYNTDDNYLKGAGVISVGIHIPVFGDPVDQGGFVTPEADLLAPGQNYAPAARINRRSDVLELDRWQTTIASEILRKASVKFESLNATLSNDGKLSVVGSVSAEDNIDGTRLQVWVIEDDIDYWQLQPDGNYEEHYSHHAVYRCSLTGFEGESITINRNSSTEFELLNQIIPSVCNPENLRVVAFIETDDAGVLNAFETHVINQ